MKNSLRKTLQTVPGVILILSLLLSGKIPTVTKKLAPATDGSAVSRTLGITVAQAQSGAPNPIYLPLVTNGQGSPIPVGGTDWPQLAHDPQRTNATSEQVNPPYCYAWKWYGVPFASRAQPVVAGGRLFIGGMDGVLYARDATTGAHLWTFTTGGPIRHSPGVGGSIVVVSSHDGGTYGVDAASGAEVWQASTGASATAPLIDAVRGRVFVASTNGRLTGLNLSNGSQLWAYDSGAPIMTSPSLSTDGSMVYFGNEAIQAVAVSASNGARVWQTALQGQSLSERYPVVTNSAILFRSQPLYFFHKLLQAWGDDVMDQAGGRLSDWTADWNNVRPKIVNFLNGTPSAQTFFALNPTNGGSLGTAPVLYTYGNNDIPAVPVVQNGQAYLPYRARHGIQTDSNTVHVSTRYDAELGQMNLTGLDISGLRASRSLSGAPEFRLTSDEPAMLTMSGSILWVDNWERVGGLNVQTGELIGLANVSNTWPECYSECGPGGPRPFFPMSGSGAAYPFPSPRAGEGHSRSGLVIANQMLYWRVVEGGIGALAHDPDGSCSAPRVWSQAPHDPLADWQPDPAAPVARPLADYVEMDLTVPSANPPQDLVNRLRGEVRALLTTANGNHLLPMYLERGFTSHVLWPYNAKAGETGLPSATYESYGNVFWHDPGELLLSMAMAYPYLDGQLQTDLKTYMSQEMQRYPPLQDLPWNGSTMTWLRSGSPRERYAVPFRSTLSNWPPPAVNFTALYGLWLWSKNTGDWSYATSHWAQIDSLFSVRSASGAIKYYADIAGAIGYARLAKQIKGVGSVQHTNGVNAAVSAMQTGLNFAAFRDRANNDYKDPRDQATGWYAPVFFGLTPEVGLYLREQFSGQPQTYLASLEGYNSQGEGLVWWYLTQVGAHAEDGETSYEMPTAAWSHFLAHAYILGEPQSALEKYLDRPWTNGDLYSIQKLSSALQAP